MSLLTAIALLPLLTPLADDPSSALPTFANRREIVSQVLHDVDESGRLWASGRDWKMSFDDDGARYFPRLGKRAVQPHDLVFSLEGNPVSSVHRSANSITLERGSISETWHLSPDSVEQTFVLRERAPAGDVAFRIQVATDLEVEDDADGVLFRAPGLGDTRYGDATTRDARGSLTHSESRWHDGAIEIVLPQAFLAAASYPLTVDPIVTTFNVDGSSADCRTPDVAWSADAGVFLVVYERFFNSVSDRDVVARRYLPDGTILDEVGVEISSDDSAVPAVASHGAQFLIAWERHAGLNDSIRARSRTATSIAQGATFGVTTATQTFPRSPRIGAALATGVTFPYLVTYSFDPIFGGIDRDVRVQFCSASNANGPGTTFNTAANLVEPSVGPSAGLGGRHLVSWTVKDGGPLDAVQAALFTVNGTQLGSLVNVATGGFANGRPAVTGDGSEFLIAWCGSVTPALAARPLIRRYTASGSPVPKGPTIDLGLMLQTTGLTASAHSVAAAQDDCRYTIAVTEVPFDQSPPNVRISTFFADTDVHVVEARTKVSSLNVTQFDAAIAALTGAAGAAHRSAVVWTTDGANADDVDGLIHSGLGAGGFQIAQTGCGGNAEPKLVTKTKVFAIGDPIDLLADVAPNAIGAMLAIGPITTIPLCAGQSSCVLGVNPLLLLTVPPDVVVAANTPCLGALIGATIGVQVIELLPASASGSFCGPPVFSNKVRTSDTLQITFQ